MNIWSDPWIPGSVDRKVISVRGHSVLTHVRELIDPSTGTWDEELIGSIMNPLDVGRIMQIPIALNAFDDFIAWHPERNGTFSVTSSYKVQWYRTFRVHAHNSVCPSGSQNPEVWSKLWKLNIPRKVSIFC